MFMPRSSARTQRRARRWGRFALGLAVVLVLGLAVITLSAKVGGDPKVAGPRRGADSGDVMEVRVTLATDHGEPVEVWGERVLFSAADALLPVRTVEVDLTPYAGRLVRFDVEGSVKREGPSSSPPGYVGCSAALVDQRGTTSIEFVSWHNDGDRRAHVGSLGPRSRVQRQSPDMSYAYATEGPLWHVLRATQGATLLLRVMPLLAEDVEASSGGTTQVAIGEADRVAPIPAPSPSGRPPDVFIYLIDALRADHLGCYGYERNTSPHIDRFAAEAVLFERAHTPTTWTRPAVATMLTGLYPSVHHVHDSVDRLDDSALLVSEVLRRSGYRSYCVVTNPHVSETWGFNQGYEAFEFYDGLVSTATDLSDWIYGHVSTFLAQEDSDQPLFMYLHALEPHGPYSPSSEARSLFDRGGQGICDGTGNALAAAGNVYPWLSSSDVRHLVDLYDAEIYDNDRSFGEFLSLLQRHGRYENALIILTADHGEAFGEHDTLAHGSAFGQEEMHIPLIIRFPGGRSSGGRVRQAASLVDLVPTVLSQTDVESGLGDDLPGMDLSECLRRDLAEKGRRIYGEMCHRGGALDLLAVVDEDGYKRVVKMSRGGTARRAVGLWDTEADPAEQVDLSTALPARAAYLEQLLACWMVAQADQDGRVRESSPPSTEMSEQMKRQLRALGYLH
jgi:arylsulfatase A-like enzyme